MLECCSSWRWSSPWPSWRRSAGGSASSGGKRRVLSPRASRTSRTSTTSRARLQQRLLGVHHPEDGRRRFHLRRPTRVQCRGSASSPRDSPSCRLVESGTDRSRLDRDPSRPSLGGCARPGSLRDVATVVGDTRVSRERVRTRADGSAMGAGRGPRWGLRLGSNLRAATSRHSPQPGTPGDQLPT